MVNLAINGFGRIGAAALKIALERNDVNVVAINNLGTIEAAANLLKYDSVYGRYPKPVRVEKNVLVIGIKRIQYYSEKDPAKLPWKKLRVQVVIESTGVFLDKNGAKKHLQAGAKRVVISAPSKDSDIPTHVISINSDDLSKTSDIINNASCTTNCISPVIAVMYSVFGIEKAMMSTIHAYTGDQNLVDGHHKDPRRARAAALNIIPTSTGAAIATTEVLPELKGLFDGLAFRVPVPVGSLSDLTMVVKRNVTVEEVNAAFEKACRSPRYKGVMSATYDPLVSSDIVGATESAIVDLSLTKVVGGNLVKVIAWYDNEMGYSHRLVEQAVNLGKTI